LKLDKREKAITELEKSLQFDDQQPGALVNLGQAYFARAEQSDLRRAHDLFARAEKLSPDPSIARALLVTSIRRHDQNSARAEYSQYTSGIDSAPAEVSGPAARLEIGRSLLEVGLNDQAIQELHAVLATEPDNAPAIAALGKAYRVAGDIPAAGK